MKLAAVADLAAVSLSTAARAADAMESWLPGTFPVHAPPAFFPDYLDWNIGAKANVNNWFNVDVRYYDTDIASECPAANGKHWCGSKIVATLSRTF